MKFRIKHTEIDAVQFFNTAKGLTEMAAFCGSEFTGIIPAATSTDVAKALVSNMRVSEGDYVARQGTHSRISVLKAGILRLLYTPADSERPTPREVVEAVSVETAMQAALASAKPRVAYREPVATPLTDEDVRVVARTAGEVRYASTAPCRNGHATPERYVSCNSCVACNHVCNARRTERTRAALSTVPGWAKDIQTMSMK